MNQGAAADAKRSGSGRLPAEEAARLDDRLLDAALAVFLDQGYAQTTMDRIVRAAGASTKTVYERYRNKNEIITAAVRRIMEQGVPTLVGELDAGAEGAEPRAVLIAIGEKLARIAMRPEALGMYRLAVSESARFPDLARLYAEGSGRVGVALARLFARWDQNGKLPLGLKPENAAGVFLDLVVATPRNRAVIGKALSRPALKVHVTSAVDVFLVGCGRKPSG